MNTSERREGLAVPQRSSEIIDKVIRDSKNTLRWSIPVTVIGAISMLPIIQRETPLVLYKYGLDQNGYALMAYYIIALATLGNGLYQTAKSHAQLTGATTAKLLK